MISEELVFRASERFSQDVGDHVLRRDIDYVDAFLLDVLADEVVANVHVLEPSVVCGIDCQEYSPLIVGDKRNGTGLVIPDLLLE